ncbi:MAG: hypothetical protein IPF96_15665 [Rhodobacter sp.]|nr:hypothetical protein [Rhodobacter sp.]
MSVTTTTPSPLDPPFAAALISACFSARSCTSSMAMARTPLLLATTCSTGKIFPRQPSMSDDDDPIKPLVRPLSWGGSRPFAFQFPVTS